MGAELDFKKWLLKELDVWSESYEPRKGSGVGMPDVQFLLMGSVLPVELKVGRIEADTLKWEGDKPPLHLFPEKVEPAQIVWHRNFWRSGGKALLLIGVKAPHGYAVWAAPREALKELNTWRDGWKLDYCTQVDIGTFKLLLA